MSKVSITKQYSELDDYAQIKDYISKVLDNFSDLDNLDSNDIYEIVYAQKLCKSKLEQGIENDVTRKAFVDTLVRIALITDLLTDDIIKKAMKNPLDKNKVNKVNSVKLSKQNKVPALIDKSNPRFGNSTQEYFKRILFKTLVIGLSLFCILGEPNLMEKATKSIIEINMGITENDEDMSVIDNEDTVEVEENTSLTNSESDLKGSNESLANVSSSYMKVVKFFIRLVSLILLVTTSITMMIDVMYITFPWFRYIVDSRKEDGEYRANHFISSNAIEAVALEGTIVGYHYSDSYDKVGTARALLDNMEDSLNKHRKTDREAEEHFGNILRIKNRVTACKSEYERLKQLADAEVYYTGNKKYFDSILKEI